MMGLGDQEPPIRHYPLAEVLVGQPVWHIYGVLRVQEPDGSTYLSAQLLSIGQWPLSAKRVNAAQRRRL